MIDEIKYIIIWIGTCLTNSTQPYIFIFQLIDFIAMILELSIFVKKPVITLLSRGLCYVNVYYW